MLSALRLSVFGLLTPHFPRALLERFPFAGLRGLRRILFRCKVAAPKIFFRYYFVNGSTGEKSQAMQTEVKWTAGA
ncbi:MAG: hypothetical protein J1D85_01160 [Bacteroidales bacterium]|nr:hypothetical protein [Bacteroidales bacterium]